jgi:hypothetical protein
MLPISVRMFPLISLQKSPVGTGIPHTLFGYEIGSSISNIISATLLLLSSQLQQQSHPSIKPENNNQSQVLVDLNGIKFFYEIKKKSNLSNFSNHFN